MTDRPTTPATEAGRALLEDNGPHVVTGEHSMLRRILAIEAESFMDGARASWANREAIEAEAASPAALDADRLTAIIESRMSRDLAWLDDDGKTVTRFGPDQVAHALLHLYRTGDVVSGLPPLSRPASPAALDVDDLAAAIHWWLYEGWKQHSDAEVWKNDACPEHPDAEHEDYTLMASDILARPTAEQEEWE